MNINNNMDPTQGPGPGSIPNSNPQNEDSSAAKAAASPSDNPRNIQPPNTKDPILNTVQSVWSKAEGKGESDGSNLPEAGRDPREEQRGARGINSFEYSNNPDKYLQHRAALADSDDEDSNYDDFDDDSDVNGTVIIDGPPPYIPPHLRRDSDYSPPPLPPHPLESDPRFSAKIEQIWSEFLKGFGK